MRLGHTRLCAPGAYYQVYDQVKEQVRASALASVIECSPTGLTAYGSQQVKSRAGYGPDTGQSAAR